MTLKDNDIVGLETRYRANLVNSLGGFKSAVLIGTQSEEGNNNLAIFSSLFHLGASPALCGIIVRPTEEIGQNTLGNILASKQYTVNHIQRSFYQQAHQCSAKYEQGESEFDAVGLTPQFEENIKAPFVQESNIKFACELVQKIDIELNGTTLIIGKIVYVMLPDETINDGGFIDIESNETITCSSLDSYHTTQKIGRLSYAKTDKPIVQL
jgi:flavin reductase (DIM6/NTAB) family NADH-FMN oxidoreductase RutF